MKSLKGTQTEKNILTAFAGESQARNRYDFFAAKAKSDGYVLVRDIFQETALQEKEHAKRLFKFLEGGDVEIVGAFPAGIIGATEANLLASAAGENHEHTEMYPSFAAVAEKEGFSEIAAVMRNIAVAEAYPDLKANVNFQQLQAELSNTEDKISYMRQSFNDTVMKYNTAIQTFPAVLFAGVMGFKECPSFTAEEGASAAPKVTF